MHREEHLQCALDLLSTCQEGRGVLKEIDRLGIEIIITDLGYAGLYQPQSNILKIDSALSVFEMASTLSHEVRHAWQFDTLGWHDRIGCFETLRTLVSIGRMLEGDAYAFQDIVEDALRAAQAKTPYAASPQAYCDYFMRAQKTLDNYDHRRISAHAQYVQNMAVVCQAFKAADPGNAKNFVKDAFNANVRFSRLRRLCVAGVDLTAPNYLQTVGAQDLWRAIHTKADGSASFQDIASHSREHLKNYRMLYDAKKA